MTLNQNTPLQILKKYYGYDTFRLQQAEIIDTIISGRDCLVLMPTGGGKSLCYQIPAIIKGGTTVVVSPLLALMKDQVDTLDSNGIPAAMLNSLQNETETVKVKIAARRGDLRLLYISPERLMGEIDGLLREMNISLFAIDEAHCISQWGHDFRPEYNRLSVLKKYFPKVPLMALTATADKLTREDIVTQLAMDNPQVFISSFDRPNLTLSVRKNLNKKQKLSAILSFIEQHPRQSGIIYCMSRNSTEILVRELSQYGISVTAYHAGLSSRERETAQQAFLNDRVQIICATIAFGMGIDKSNVRWVIHYNMPKSIECYYQEIGRAGRDGMKGDTLLFYSLGDVVMLSKFAEESGQKKINLEKLRRMQQYAESPICRRRILLSYFGETVDHDCGNCDVCKNPPQRFDGSVLAQKALSAIVRTEQQVTFNLLIDVLRGSHKAEILKRNYDKIKTFGVGSDLTFRQWQGYLLQMLQLGLFEMLYNQGERLSVTELGWKALRNELEIKLTWVTDEPVQSVAKTPKKTMRHEVAELSDDEKLFEALRGLRMKLAVEEDKPAYTIFTDRVLQEMVERKPVTLYDFARISGVGEAKVSRYGKQFVDLLRKELNVKREKGDSYIETLMLLRQGLTIEQVAESRNLKLVTIYSHIAELIISRKLTDWSNYISVFEIESVANVISSSESKTQNLKPIYEALNGEIDYGKIRLALAVLSFE